MNRRKAKTLRIDRPLLLATLLLLGVGLVMVFSASANMSETRFGSAYLFVRKQLLWDALGAGAMFLCMRIDYHRWQKWCWPLLGIAILSLGAVLAVGPVVKGAQRWIHMGPVTFQPSEIAKLALLLWLADYLDRHKSHLKNFRRGFLPPMMVVGAVLGLILKEPDLGTPILLGGVCLMMLFLAGARLTHLGGTILAGTGPLIYELFCVGYRYRRLKVFTNPWADASGAGYQLTQSLMAFGSGGLFGKGLGASTLKLLYLPDPHTDFIFPVIGEELGFIGALTLVLLFVFWGIRGWQVARRAPDLFGQLFAAGVTGWVLLQAVINMSVSCGLMPTKGLPLPFVSFGGSSLVITMMAVGIMLNISSQGHMERRSETRRSHQ
ncbi:MAG: putative lipid II flippase FtsW [Elusimicrobiota bacterium]|jgi:cell division protein FtsW